MLAICYINFLLLSGLKLDGIQRITKSLSVFLMAKLLSSTEVAPFVEEIHLDSAYLSTKEL